MRQFVICYGTRAEPIPQRDSTGKLLAYATRSEAERNCPALGLGAMVLAFELTPGQGREA